LLDELDVGEREAHLVREHVERDGIVDVGRELAELEHRLARQDDFLSLIVAGDPEARPRQAMVRPVATACSGP
jgi:hypothetical protein